MFDPSGHEAEKYLKELISLQSQYSSADAATRITLHNRANDLREMIKNSSDYIENWYGFTDEVNNTSLFDTKGSITLKQTQGLYDFLVTSESKASRDEAIANAALGLGSGLAITYGGEAVAGSGIVQAIGSGLATAWDKVKNFFTGAGSTSALNNGVNFTQTTLKRMEDPNRFVPVQTLVDAIKNGIPKSDPQGTSAIMYTIEVVKNGKYYQLEVLYDKATNTILHFLYK